MKMATRLDRLLILLDSGSTPFTRKTAAEQIGEIQKVHPHELHNLLRKVLNYITSKSWETRVAASHAVEAIAKNVKKWDPSSVQLSEGDHVDESPSDNRPDYLVFETFDMMQVLVHGMPLLSSTGEELLQLENDSNYIHMNPQEQLAFHRQQLKQRLGLVAQGKLFSTGIESLIEDSDITDIHFGMATKENRQTISSEVLRGLSARERNRAKRKAKLAAKKEATGSSSNTSVGECDEPPSKKPCTTTAAAAVVDSHKEKHHTAEIHGSEESEEWPFTWFCEELFKNLFNPSWEIRHGAASALRNVLKIHGNTAGVSVHTSHQKRTLETQLWLSDAAIRLLCVLALDRFADFISDQVVAPVRATTAQVLGAVCYHLDEANVLHVVSLLLTLASQEQWEIRHASLMGIQHLLAARSDLSTTVLPLVNNSIMSGLQDVDDDVRSIAAGALLPVADTLTTCMPGQVHLLQKILWNALLNLDDLSASTSSIMELLYALMSCGRAGESQLSDKEYIELIPRLYPFLAHSIASVRASCLFTLTKLVELGYEHDNEAAWLQPLLKDLLSRLFQRIVLEGLENIVETAQQIWQLLISHSSPEVLTEIITELIGPWLSLLVTPVSVPVDASLLVDTLSKGENTSEVYLGGCLGIESPVTRRTAAFSARVSGTRALGTLIQRIMTSEKPFSLLLEWMTLLVSHPSAVYRSVAALLASVWHGVNTDIMNKMGNLLTDQPVYEETAPFLMSLQKDCHILINALEKKDVNISNAINPSGFTAEDAVKLATTTYTDCLKSVDLSHNEKQELESLHHNLLTSLGQLQEHQQSLHSQVLCCAVGAVVTQCSLPQKLNPLIRPLMDCIRTEEDSLLQSLAAKWLSKLLELCRHRVPCPNSKIIKNLCGFVCCDSNHTPPLSPPTLPLHTEISIEDDASSTCNSPVEQEKNCEGWNMLDGIITLAKHTKDNTRTSSRRKRPGRPPAVLKEAISDAQGFAYIQDQAVPVQRRGGETTLKALSNHFDEELPSALPYLWNVITNPIEQDPPFFTSSQGIPEATKVSVQSIVNNLQVLEVLASSLHTSLVPKVLSLLPDLLKTLGSSFTSLRHMTARIIATFAHLDLHYCMKFIIDQVLPCLDGSGSVPCRQGAIEALACLLDSIELNILCYVVLLIMPILGRMSDQDRHVRHMASQCFANLVVLMPLESSAKTPPEMPQTLADRRVQERRFLEQLLDTSKLESYHVPIPINASLRKYQQDGINWLGFLNKYKLHGILCDDMGLGKTLQSICIIAGDHHYRNERYKVTKGPDCLPIPSLVVCPPTLTGHWLYEVEKFCSTEHIKALQYSGAPTLRSKLQASISKYNLIIASYDIVRNDIDFFRTIDWNYCILDEGHIIKNAKTKITRSIKQLRCNHRLILTGTPIQNNVLDLWSLFDFLMPGFLGTERQFNSRYGKPILLSKDAKSSSKEQEAGALAMEALHRQVLPFLLRRMKEDVLDDLPPKIIQDYHCDLSPLQVKLYEDFAKSQTGKRGEDKMDDDSHDTIKQDEKTKKDTHIFQALQYLRKVCNHPALVVGKHHPLYNSIMERLKADKSSLRDIHHSAKLVALKHLLHECGIGDDSEGQDSAVVSQHRVLLFCQYKSMLDIIENDLFKEHMPSVTYLRLDGSVAPSQRQPIVHRFNSDPSIDILLLTTHVGGLGLNLTGADTVIFYEHDWNPMKDLQAMDRAHRIGQKRVVNVYRLITRGTLEEKIMSLQRFKLNVANTVITKENSSLLSMDTSDVLDLFQLGESQPSQPATGSAIKAAGSSKQEGLKSILENLPELWSEDQYNTEYDLTNFVQSLSSQ